ncbi:hypothetical protein QBC39DRAFT_350057 [Podospora conica]|nr:hypothetical protein QBC39DRAFT_350057 [Schizothecium conicum]
MAYIGDEVPHYGNPPYQHIARAEEEDADRIGIITAINAAQGPINLYVRPRALDFTSYTLQHMCNSAIATIESGECVVAVVKAPYKKDELIQNVDDVRVDYGFHIGENLDWKPPAIGEPVVVGVLTIFLKKESFLANRNLWTSTKAPPSQGGRPKYEIDLDQNEDLVDTSRAVEIFLLEKKGYKHYDSTEKPHHRIMMVIHPAYQNDKENYAMQLLEWVTKDFPWDTRFDKCGGIAVTESLALVDTYKSAGFQELRSVVVPVGKEGKGAVKTYVLLYEPPSSTTST